MRRRQAARGHRPRSRRASARSFAESRPDRIAFWAVMLAVIAMVAGAASSRADSGATGSGGGLGTGQSACPQAAFGKRTLKLGDCGGDVKTLNWVLRAEDFRVPLDRAFRRPTDASVRSFQQAQGLRGNGIVDDRTARRLRRNMSRRQATWYGPGFFGNRTACGERLTRRTLGVAHRRLPCGTKVVIGYHGRWVRTRVIDRGPYAKDRYRNDWDLTKRTAQRLDFEGTDRVRAAVLR